MVPVVDIKVEDGHVGVDAVQVVAPEHVDLLLRGDVHCCVTCPGGKTIETLIGMDEIYIICKNKTFRKITLGGIDQFISHLFRPRLFFFNVFLYKIKKNIKKKNVFFYIKLKKTLKKKV